MRTHILSSRFSNDTWRENETYRTRRNSVGCIYGCPLRISHKVHVNAFAYVLEMNNSTNRIEGVGVIRNYPNVEQPPWIYANNNYNRYIYEGEYRMDRDAIDRYDTDLVESIETICFKGKTHMKRGAGLTLVPKKLLLHRHRPEPGCSACTIKPDTNIARDLQTVFRLHFRGAVEGPDAGGPRTI
jgi:hypothetical protein